MDGGDEDDERIFFPNIRTSPQSTNQSKITGWSVDKRGWWTRGGGLSHIQAPSQMIYNDLRWSAMIRKFFTKVGVPMICDDLQSTPPREIDPANLTKTGPGANFWGGGDLNRSFWHVFEQFWLFYALNSQ